MVESQKPSRRKWFMLPLVLVLVFVLASTLFWYTTINGRYNHYYENTTQTIHISSNGDITVPTTFNANNTIQRIGDTYILTGNLQGNLIIEKSNIVFDGKGFNVEAVSSHVAIKLANVNNVTLKNVAITYGSLLIESSDHNKIFDVDGSNFLLYSSNNNEIINYSGSGMVFKDSSNNKVADSNLSYEFSLDDSNFNLILNNNCTGQGRRISLSDSSHNLIFGNTLKSYWWISMCGDSSYNKIVANNITMSQKHYDNLKGTNYIYHNNFFDFSWNHSSTINSANVWSSDEKGNYYSDYLGTDANHDGIGDTPYVIDVNNVDDCPLIAPVNINIEPIPPIT